MNAKEAYKAIKKTYPDRDIKDCYECVSVFVFNAWPKGFDPSPLKLQPFDSLFSVDKSTGKIRAFKPFDIPVEEYKAAKKVVDFK